MEKCYFFFYFDFIHSIKVIFFSSTAERSKYGFLPSIVVNLPDYYYQRCPVHPNDCEMKLFIQQILIFYMYAQ